jgi:ribosomal protein S18 acetylase RimI-like enzyme
MSDEQQKTKDEMIAKANQAVKKVAHEFVGGLNQRVEDLEKAILTNDRNAAVEMAYNLETEAATFGWPRVTRICKWLRKIFSGDYDQKPDAEDALKTLNALKLMVADPGNPDEVRDEELFRKIYPAMQKVVTDI